jgi:hypothetical protein
MLKAHIPQKSKSPGVNVNVNLDNLAAFVVDPAPHKVPFMTKTPNVQHIGKSRRRKAEERMHAAINVPKAELILNRRKQIGGVAVDGERAQVAQRLFISSAANESDSVEAGFVRSFEVEAGVTYSDGLFR